MHELEKLIAERDELQRKIDEMSDALDKSDEGEESVNFEVDVNSSEPKFVRPIDEAESQVVFPLLWKSSDDVPRMLTPDQAAKSLDAISRTRVEAIGNASENLASFEVAYSLRLAEFQEELDDAKIEVAEARARLREKEAAISEFRSGNTSRRVELQSESRQCKVKFDAMYFDLSRAIAASRKRYDEELSLIRSLARDENNKRAWERQAIEREIRRKKAREQVGVKLGRPRKSDVADYDDFDESESGDVSATNAVDSTGEVVSLSYPTDHPMIDYVPEGQQVKEGIQDRLPWEDIAAECQVQPENYSDWLSNYASGWGNHARIDFARKRVMARRAGVEVPDWPSGIEPGKYLGRSELPPGLHRFYSEIPEKRKMKFALLSSQEAVGEASEPKAEEER